MKTNYEDLMPFFNEMENDEDIKKRLQEISGDKETLKILLKVGKNIMDKEIAKGNFANAKQYKKGMKAIEIYLENKER